MAALLVGVMAGGCASLGLNGSAGRSEQEIFVIQTVSAMAEALTIGDLQRFMGKVSSGYYRGYDQLERRLAGALRERRGYSLEVTVGEIAVEEPKIIATVRWKSKWSATPQAPEGAAAGTIRLVFMKGMGIKLIDHGGDLLFGL